MRCALGLTGPGAGTATVLRAALPVVLGVALTRRLARACGG
ncbi:MAG: hypothetical protein JWR62_2445 [Modestobacter sp.]|jgi:hypothetical protein|nr:hypothetical protein [Modestobacter sp.]